MPQCVRSRTYFKPVDIVGHAFAVQESEVKLRKRFRFVKKSNTTRERTQTLEAIRRVKKQLLANMSRLGLAVLTVDSHPFVDIGVFRMLDDRLELSRDECGFHKWIRETERFSGGFWHVESRAYNSSELDCTRTHRASKEQSGRTIVDGSGRDRVCMQRPSTCQHRCNHAGVNEHALNVVPQGIYMLIAVRYHSRYSLHRQVRYRQQYRSLTDPLATTNLRDDEEVVRSTHETSLPKTF